MGSDGLYPGKGVAMVMDGVCTLEDADKAIAALNSKGQGAKVIGEIVPGDERVVLC